MQYNTIGLIDLFDTRLNVVGMSSTSYIPCLKLSSVSPGNGKISSVYTKPADFQEL